MKKILKKQKDIIKNKTIDDIKKLKILNKKKL